MRALFQVATVELQHAAILIELYVMCTRVFNPCKTMILLCLIFGGGGSRTPVRETLQLEDYMLIPFRGFRRKHSERARRAAG
jgi:hypothetical protein